MLNALPQSYFRFALLLLVLQIFTEAHGQNIEVEIAIDAEAKTAKISGRFVGSFRSLNERNVVFKKEVSGNTKLAQRITDLELRNDAIVKSKRLMAGEYIADSLFDSWTYKIDLTFPANEIATAHSSWVGDETGILMLDDLLPEFGKGGQPVSARMALKLPNGWSAFSVDSKNDPMTIDVSSIERSVIFIGTRFSDINVKARSGDLRLLTSGDWHFTDDEAAGMAREIFDEYSQSLGRLPKQPFRIAILRFPTQEAPGSWEAETRGQTITIMSSDMPFKSQSQQRLHEQLRHEIFHLWFPNGIKLTGDYAWFYEGFALYQSLKLAVALNRIRFDDFLDTLSRAHTIDNNSRPRRKLVNDPALDPTVRYARGMLIAFLIDIERLKSSRGKGDLSIVLRGIFERFGPGKTKAEANHAVASYIGLQEITERYVFGTETIEWADELATIGIESSLSGRTTTLTVAKKLNGRQKEILDRLGYNNWRKIGTKR